MGGLSLADNHGTRLQISKYGRRAGSAREEGRNAELSLHLFSPDGRLTEGTYEEVSTENFESDVEAMVPRTDSMVVFDSLQPHF